MLISPSRIPCLAMYIDLRRGAHDAEIDDLVGFNMWIPFCDEGLDISSITYSGISFVAAMCCVMSSIVSFIISVCFYLKLNIFSLDIPVENTSAHNVW